MKFILKNQLQNIKQKKTETTKGISVSIFHSERLWSDIDLNITIFIFQL